MPFIAQVAPRRLLELFLFGDDYPTEDGTCVRDYLHVMNLTTRHVATLASLEGLCVHIYNLGKGQSVPVLEMVKSIEWVTDQRVPYRTAPRRGGDLPAFWADAGKAEQELGWRAECGLEAILGDGRKQTRRAMALTEC